MIILGSQTLPLKPERGSKCDPSSYILYNVLQGRLRGGADSQDPERLCSAPPRVTGPSPLFMAADGAGPGNSRYANPGIPRIS